MRFRRTAVVSIICAVLLSGLFGLDPSTAASKKKKTVTTKRRTTTRLSQTIKTASPTTIPSTTSLPANLFLSPGQTKRLIGLNDASVTLDGKTVINAPFSGGAVTLVNLSSGATALLASELPEPLEIKYVSFNRDASVVAIDTPTGATSYGGTRRVVVFNRATKALQHIDPVGLSSLSPDGSTVAYTAGVAQLGSGTTRIYLRRIADNTTEPMAIGPNGEDATTSSYAVKFSSNGRRVLFSSSFGGDVKFGVYLRDFETRRTKVLYSGDFTDGRALSGDGRVALVVGPDPVDRTRSNLVVINAETGTAEPLRLPDGRAVNARSGTLSDDGNLVAYLENEDWLPGEDRSLLIKPARKVTIYDRQKKTTGAVTLDPAIVGEFQGIESFTASADFKTFVACVVLKLEAKFELACFVHRVQ
jgi:WD40 repeat protein